MWEQEVGCASEHLVSGVHFQFTLQSQLRSWKTGYARYLAHVQIRSIEDKRSISRKRHIILFIGNLPYIQKWKKYYSNRNVVLGGGLWEEHTSC